MSAVASDYTTQYLEEVQKIAGMVDPVKIDRMIQLLLGVRKGGGRLFILGVGGSAGNAGHAVNDFRKICGMEAYAPTDNVSELTARVNDDGWESCFVNWLKGSRLRVGDAVLVFSVGGGNLEKNISGNIVHAVRHAKEIGATVLGIVGRDGGYTAQQADACLDPSKENSHAAGQGRFFAAWSVSDGGRWAVRLRSPEKRSCGRCPGLLCDTRRSGHRRWG
jgi:D-sedoheptulose 7-phosphate isomerase